MSRMLNIFENENFYDAVIEYEWHSHDPYVNNFKNSDEIRIAIHQQDIYTHPHKSFLLVKGSIIKTADKSEDDSQN